MLHSSSSVWDNDCLRLLVLAGLTGIMSYIAGAMLSGVSSLLFVRGGSHIVNGQAHLATKLAPNCVSPNCFNLFATNSRYAALLVLLGEW